MRTTIVQRRPSACKLEYIEATRDLLSAAVRDDSPDMISLPEIWPCLGADRTTKSSAGKVLPSDWTPCTAGSAYRFLSEMARLHGISLHNGSIGKLEGSKLYNTSLVFGPSGAELACYRKMHLFDVVTPTGDSYRESATYAAGERVVTCRTPCRERGLVIWYDLRFPELFLALRRPGPVITMLLAGLTQETRRDHGEILLRARAIETQRWVVAAATCGTHFDAGGGPRVTHGHSMIIDPWGTIMAQLASEVGYATVAIDTKLAEMTRAKMPIFANRRLA